MTTTPANTPPRLLAAGFPAADDATWRTLVDKALKGADFKKRLVSRTADGLEIEPLYTRPGHETAERPGAAPFTRGTATRLAAGGWRIGQIRTETTPEALAAAILADIEGGAETVTIRLAAPGQSGLSATAQALEAALAPIPLDHIAISLLPGAHGFDAGRALTALAAKRGGTANIASLGIDPLGVLARTGQSTLMKAGTPAFTESLTWLPSPATTLVADARPYHEAGASEAQEIAALASTLVAYLRASEAADLPAARALSCIGLAMAVDADLFLGLAKLRAARRVIHRVAEACGAGDAAGRMHLAVSTSERMMARRDPWVNMLRVTAAATAAAIGGADEITVLPYTWALGQPDALASRIARNAGLVLREEAGLGRIADAAGGAWALESLTDELAAKAWSIFQEWEGEGGMLAALTSGLVQDQIAAVAAARAKEIATRKIELTGVSSFPQLGDDGVKVVPWPQAPIYAGASTAKPLPAIRLAAPFEALRDTADKAPKPPKIFLASLGTTSEHGARSMWTGNLLAAAGIASIPGGDITSSAEAGRLFAESGASTAIICGTDETYALLAEATVMALKGAGASHVWLAGQPGADKAPFAAAGIDGYLHAGMDAVAALGGIQRALGIGV
jgi:methylmalonyl-CoA mutase